MSISFKNPASIPPPIPPVVRGTERYFTIDSRKVSYREYWNISPFGILITWPAKLFRARLKFVSGMALRETQREIEVSENFLTPEVRHKLQGPMNDCLRLGFHSPRYFHSVTRLGETDCFVVAMLHPSTQFVIRLFCTISVAPNVRVVKVTVALLSELQDKTYLVTVDTKPRFLAIPEAKIQRIVGGSVQALVKLHKNGLTKLQASNPPRVINTPGLLDEVSDRYEKMCNDFGFKRGIYVMLQPHELVSMPPR